MKLTRPLFIFDLEATGPDPAVDRIVQIAYKRVDVDGTFTEKSSLINPEVPIPESAIAIHGITDSQVADARTFRVIARALHGLIQGCDLGGYNILGFDIPLLWESFYRAGIEWDTTTHGVVDGFAIWRHMMPRKLINAAREFAPLKYVDEGSMHDAGVDVDVTSSVIFGQFDRWPDALHSVDEISKLTRRTINIDGEDLEQVDLAGVLARRGDGVVVFTHKRVRGVPVIDDSRYADWLLRNDFSANTKMHLMAAMGLKKSSATAA